MPVPRSLHLAKIFPRHLDRSRREGRISSHLQDATEIDHEPRGHETKKAPGAHDSTCHRRVIDEGSIRGGSKPSLSRMVLEAVHGPQVVRRNANYHRSVSVEPVSSVPILSDDNVQRCNQWTQTGTMDSLHRPPGCVLSGTNPSSGPEVLQDRLEGQGLSIQSLALRAKPGSVDFHRGDSPDREPGQSPGNKNVLLPGRLANCGKHGAPVQRIAPVCAGHDYQTGLQSQLREVVLDPLSTLQIPRYGVRSEKGGRPADSRAYRGDPGRHQIVAIPSSGLSQNVAEPPGHAERDLLNDSSGQVKRQTHSGISQIQMDPGHGRYGRSDSVTSGVLGSQVPVVASSVQVEERCVVSSPSSCVESVHGRQQLWVGGSFRPGDSFRDLETPPGQASHKYIGNDSGRPCLTPLSPANRGGACGGEHRQFHGARLPQKSGGHQVEISPGAGNQYTSVVSTTEGYTHGPSYSGEAQRSGRCVVTHKQSDINGMDPPSAGISSGQGVVVPAYGGPVRYLQEPESSDFCLPVSGSAGMEGRRAVVPVGQLERVCLPSFSSYTPVPSEGVQFGRVQSSVNSSQVAVASLVPNTFVAFIRPAEATANMAKHCQSARVSQPSEPGVVKPARVAVIRKSLLSRGFSEGVTDLVVRSTRQSTGSIYNSKWRIYVDWCSERSLDPLSLPVRDLAEFFLSLFREKSLAVSTIKGYRSAIAGVFRSSKVPDLSSDPDISRLFAGFSIERPVVRKLVPAWNLSLVLNFLTGAPFEPIRKSALKDLTHKTAFLVAFATAGRRSEIHALSVERGHIYYSADGHTVFLRPGFGFVSKNQGQEEARRPWKIEGIYQKVDGGIPDRTLCPVRALKAYLDATASIRKERLRLFISVQPNRKSEISRDTISRWLVETIQAAYKHAQSDSSAQVLAGVTGHQVRAMATSWLAFSGASPSEIKEAAFWKGQSTFSSFYLRDLCVQEGEIFSLGPLVAAQTVCHQSQGERL